MNLLRRIELVRSGLFDLDAISAKTFAFDDLPHAVVNAKTMRGLECTIVKL